MFGELLSGRPAFDTAVNLCKLIPSIEAEWRSGNEYSCCTSTVVL